MKTKTPKKTPGARGGASVPASQTEPVYRPVTRADLEAIWNKPVIVECAYGGELIRFESERRLTPDEKRRISALLEAALPPELPAEPGKEDTRYDFRAPEYLEKKEVNRRKARDLALYWCFPIFRDPARAGIALTDDEIVASVEHAKLDDAILDYAFDLLTRDTVMVDPRRVGFTSGSNSPQS